MRIGNSREDRQHNGQKEKAKRTNNDLQTVEQHEPSTKY